MAGGPYSKDACELSVAVNQATSSQIEHFLESRSHCFSPPFSSRVDVAAYAVKIRKHAQTYEVWYDGELDALMAVYANPDLEQVYVTYLCTAGVRSSQKGIGSLLIREVLCYPLPYRHIRLEVSKDNEQALRFYGKHGFTIQEERGGKYLMQQEINPGSAVGNRGVQQTI